MPSLTAILSDFDQRRKLADELGLPQIDFHTEIDSTQNALRKLADSGAPEWSVVAADYQTEGRGQHGRAWSAERARSLTFSLLLRPESIEGMALVPLRAGMAIARAIDPLLKPPVRTMVKWPNDLVVEDTKVGGVLSEAQIRGEEGLVVVGIGLNVHPFPLQLQLDERRDLPPGFLGEHLKEGISRLELFKAVIRSLRHGISSMVGELTGEEIEEFGGCDWLRGKMLSAPVIGKGRGISPEGHLVVAGLDGKIQRVIAGRVMLSHH